MAEILANYSTLPVAQPHPNTAIKRLPVLVQERIDAASLPAGYIRAIADLRAAKHELADCTTIESAKTWSEKADLVAQAAKILKDAELASEAREVKFHAYRRMGLLAEKLQPAVRKRVSGVSGGFRGSSPGPAALLRGRGLSYRQADNARVLARMKESDFDAAVKAGRSITAVAATERNHRCSDAWMWLTRGEGTVRLPSVRNFLRQRAARDVASRLAPGEAKAARELARDLIEWLDEFEQWLPKE